MAHSSTNQLFLRAIRARFNRMVVKPPPNRHLTSVVDASPLQVKRLINPEPSKVPLGLVKACLVTIASLYLGGLIAEKGAGFLEENEIFVPEDDDDD